MSKRVMILGGDGHLGWSVGLNRAFRTDDEIFLIDSYLKRDLQKQCGVKELNPLPHLQERVNSYSRITGKHNISHFSIDVSNYQSLSYLIDRCKPNVIINAAQQPSAPFSMMSPQNAALTLSNNEKTCLNTLWAVADLCPGTLVINVGSAGVYQSIDTDYVPSENVDLVFFKGDKARYINNSWLPMQATDIYHQSKTHTFGITEMLTTIWGLKTITVHQSVIFGQCSDPQLDDDSLYTRFNYDSIFGTVLNRFACQAVLGEPLTVYGDGSSQTNVICLCDTIDVFDDLIDSILEPGTHKVINNFTERLSIIELAQKVKDIHGGGSIVHIANPRVEPNLSLEKQFEPSTYLSRSLENSISNTLDFVSRFRYNIDIGQFRPTVSWTR